MKLADVARAAGLVAVIAAGAAPAAHGNIISFRLQAVVPVVCDAQVAISTTQGTGIVQASLRQHCNTDHMLTVSVDPEIASRATGLRIALDGDWRSAASQGRVDFPQNAHFNGVRQLSITASGLSPTDTERLNRSVTVSVQPI